jgi:hypothetical protein
LSQEWLGVGELPDEPPVEPLPDGLGDGLAAKTLVTPPISSAVTSALAAIIARVRPRDDGCEGGACASPPGAGMGETVSMGSIGFSLCCKARCLRSIRWLPENPLNASPRPPRMRG